MASWITIYLQDSLERLEIKEIQKGIEPADWWTLGEEFDLEEEDVDNFMDQLRWHENPLRFHAEDDRPIKIHIWSDPSRIKEEIEELAEKALPETVKRHSENVRTIVAIELGFSQLKTMYEVIAFEIAYWLAETKHGLICSPYDLWYDHDEHRWDPIKN